MKKIDFSFPKVFLWNFIAIVSISIFLSILLEKIGDNDSFDTNYVNLDKNNQINIAVLIAPWFETLFFQLIPIWALFSIFEKKWTSIVIPSFLFAMTHSYNLVYIVYSFIIGIFLSNIFCEGFKKYKNWGIAYLITVIFHALFNLFVFFHNNFFYDEKPI